MNVVLKFILVLLCFHIYHETVNAQNVFFSQEENINAANGHFSVIGWCGDRLYTYRSSKDGFYMDAYNDSMRKLATINLDFFPRKISDVQFINYENKIIVIYQSELKGKVFVHGALLDSRGVLKEKPRLFDSVNVNSFGKNKDRIFNISFSNDKSKIVLSAWGYKNKIPIVITTLLDNNLQHLSHNVIQLDLEDENVERKQEILANDGTLLILAARNSNKELSSAATIYTLSTNGELYRNEIVPDKRLFISDIYIKGDMTTNDCYIGAFYATKSNGNVEGMLIGKFIPKDEAQNQLTLLPIDNDLLNKASAKNKKKALNDFLVKDIIVRNDGGFVLIAENYYVTSKSYAGQRLGYYSMYYSDPFRNNSIREYFYGDILAISYNADNQKEWSRFIHKEQYSQEDGGLFSSYSTLNSGASMVFIYNDFKGGKSNVNLAALDNKGEVQMKKLFEGNMPNSDWIPKAGKQTDITEIVIPHLQKNNFGFIRLAF